MPRAGRPRRKLPMVMLPMRELGYAMAQQRRACGVSLDDSNLEWINETILELYPEAGTRADGHAGQISVPHRVRSRQTLDFVERGKTDRESWRRHWLGGADDLQESQLRGNTIPAWLVRAYDRALGADGYLIDFYRWTVAMDRAHRKNPPTWPDAVPANTPVADLPALLTSGFENADEAVSRLLRQYADELARRAKHRRASDSKAWRPYRTDRSAMDDDGSADFPEGWVLPVGQVKIARWVFRNTGKRKWQDRVLLHVRDTRVPVPEGLVAPPFVPMPDTAPGETASVDYPVRAPDFPGTYRACFKQAWPDGTLCYPTTLVGALITVIVPPRGVAEGWHLWAAE